MEGCLEKMALCKAKCLTCPVARKCCFCISIRRGVIVIGYFNIVADLLFLPALVFLLVKHLTLGPEDQDHGIQDPHIHLPLNIAYILINVLMNVVLLIGAHRKIQLLLKIYFYFGVVFQLVTLCVDVFYFDYLNCLENVVYVFFLGLNIYLLFMVYNTITIIEENTDVQYVAYSETKNKNQA